MLIIAAAPTVDQEALDSLLEKHDQARTSEEKEVVGQEVETLIGSTVRAMLGRDLRGLGLSEEEFGALVTELVHRALAESGITRLRREDLVPERLVEEMHTTSQGHRLWTLLPPDLREELEQSTRA
ncbi:MAG: hypothetical protein M5U26_12550 [Planctomycetota bacterium]|nr:hypothetical protein [Planctomycetota bacterium]